MVNGETMKLLTALVEDRNWDQFHTPENLAKSIAIEAGELLECYQWSDANLDLVREELADVMTYCLLLAQKLDLDPDAIIQQKLAKTAEKYPVAKSWGNSAKYDQL
jgi:dCTP diphosphatase